MGMRTSSERLVVAEGLVGALFHEYWSQVQEPLFSYLFILSRRAVSTL